MGSLWQTLGEEEGERRRGETAPGKQEAGVACSEREREAGVGAVGF